MTTKGRPVAIALAVVFAFAVLVQGEPAPGERRLIIHADDLGMSHAVNRATFEALEHGWVTSASILVPCPWFPEVAAWAKKHTDADLGIHLAVNSEWTGFRWGPLSGRSAVPSLLDEDGYMALLEEGVTSRAKLDEVERELRRADRFRAQVRREHHAPRLAHGHAVPHAGAVRRLPEAGRLVPSAAIDSRCTASAAGRSRRG